MSVYSPGAGLLLGDGGARQENPCRLKGQLACSMQWKNNEETLFSNKVEAKDQHPRWSSHHYTYAVARLCPQLHTQMCITHAHTHRHVIHACLSYGQPTLKKTLLRLYCILLTYFVWKRHTPWHTGRDQKTTWWSWLTPSTMRFLGPNPVCKTWRQAPFPAEPSPWPIISILIEFFSVCFLWIFNIVEVILCIQFYSSPFLWSDIVT